MDGERTLPAAVLHDRLQRALDQLNGEELSRELPRTAQAYIAHWLAQGWLERRLPEGADQEQYELSTQALQAIRFADSLEQSRVAATESRLALVIEQLSQLAAQTESDPDARLSALRDERDRIDAEIARVGVGRVATLDGKRALERARQIIGLADDLTEDFQAFWRLLNDAEQSAQLDAALETVLARGFARKLDRDERAFLRGFTGTMLDRGGQVHDVLQHFARSLRGFVQSRGYLEQRRLNQLLKQAQSEALALRDEFTAQRPIGRDLQLTTSRLRSWSQWKLHDPRSAHVDGSVQRNDAASISLESVGDLVASSEIDFRTLRRDLHDLLAIQPKLSIAQALSQRDAPQGLGSVIGYLSLGTRHGTVVEGEQETAHWRGGDGQWRRARIPLVWFTQEKRHELA
jgi:hypothetical protein